LIRYTYVNFPYYATKSAIADSILNKEEQAKVVQQKRTFTEPTLFTIGYEGISLDTYINKLIVNDVKILCDVRKNAYSQKYGFSKSQLKTACEGVEIEYLHIPNLGIVSEKRQELKVKEKYFDEFVRKKDLYFFLGTTKQFHNVAPNPFIIIGTFYPPKTKKMTNLFEK
jgi:uncharacterized protein (DUF488 family)